MKKPSPYMLPLSCGLFLYLLWMLCCAFRQSAPLPASSSSTDSTQFDITLLAATSPMLIGIRTMGKTTANIRLEWQVLLNGLPGPKGVFPAVSILPHHPKTLRLPLKLAPGNEEAWLRVTCRHGHNTSVYQFLLRRWHGDVSIPPTGELTFTDSNNIFTVTAPATLIAFDKQTGWLLHYEAGHVLLMGDTAGVQPDLWPTIPPRLQLFSTSTGPQLVIVRTEYTLPETASLLHLSYTINSDGDMLVSQTVEPDTTLHLPDSVHIPTLPGFGMRWLLPAGLDSIKGFGVTDSTATASTPPLASPAALTSTPSTPPAPASQITPAILHSILTPAMHTRETRWLTITGDKGKGLRISADSSMLEIHALFSADNSLHSPQLTLQPTGQSGSTRQFSFKLTPVSHAKPF